MKKTVSFLGWVSVFITTIALILTILTTYQFLYVKYFNSYYTLQWCISLTMFIWAIKLIDFKNKTFNKMYSIMCIFFAVGTIFFIFMKVY